MVVLTVDYGRPPWVALMLACSFGTYGLAKKQADAGAVESLAFETALLAPFAAAYLGWLAWQGQSTFGAHGARARAAAGDHRHRHRAAADLLRRAPRPGCRW